MEEEQDLQEEESLTPDDETSEDTILEEAEAEAESTDE
jgi:hypothetical protein